MKVYHPEAGVFDPFGMWDDEYEDDNGRIIKIDIGLAKECEELLTKQDEQKFKVNSKLPTYNCKLCRNSQFYVGTYNYETYVKCTQCNIEFCVHEG